LLAGPSGFASYAWSNGETTQLIAVTSPGSYTLVVTASTGCVSPPSDPTVFIPFFCNQAPTISPASVTTTVEGTVTINLTTLTSDLDNNIDLSTLQVLVAPASGANAFFNSNAELVVDYTGIAFAGTDQLTVQVCDVAGACGQEVITIEVAGEITVYNALSPNGDGKNDVLFIQYIDALPDTKSNKLIIFNRWGSVVFEATDYDNTNNVFKGIGNNGSELPTGTYYYTLEFTSGAEKRTGFISLRR
jgi:gliding motility-associated-like protein